MLVLVLAGILVLVGIAWHLLKPSRPDEEPQAPTSSIFEERVAAQLAELRGNSEPTLNGAPVAAPTGFGRKLG